MLFLISFVLLISLEIFSEFDIAAFVIFVGEVYRAAHVKKQWVFVTDGSISELKSEDFCNSLLAICFCSPYIDDDDLFSPINCNLAGSTVSTCYLFCCQLQSKATFGSHVIWYK